MLQLTWPPEAALTRRQGAKNSIAYLHVNKSKKALTNLPPLTQVPIIAEVRPERDLTGAFSFLAPAERHHPSSYLPREPADAADDADLVGSALVGRVERVVGDHPHGRRVAVGDMLKTLGHQAHPVVEDEDAGGAGELAGHVDQHGIAVLQGGDHAVTFDMHDPEL